MIKRFRKGLPHNTGDALIHLGTIQADSASCVDFTDEISPAFDHYEIVIPRAFSGIHQNQNLNLSTSFTAGADWLSNGFYGTVFHHDGVYSISENKSYLQVAVAVREVWGRVSLFIEDQTFRVSAVLSGQKTSGLPSPQQASGALWKPGRINAIRLGFSSGKTSGIFHLYGIKSEVK